MQSRSSLAKLIFAMSPSSSRASSYSSSNSSSYSASNSDDEFDNDINLAQANYLDNNLDNNSGHPNDNDLQEIPSSIEYIDLEQDSNKPLINKQADVKLEANDTKLEQEDVKQEQEPPLKIILQPIHKSFFYYDLENCLAYLKELQAHMPQTIQKQRKKFLYYMGLFLFNLCAGIASPLPLWKLMYAAAENNYQKLLPLWNKELTSLLIALDPIEKKHSLLSNLLSQYRNFENKWFNLHCEYKTRNACSYQTVPQDDLCYTASKQFCEVGTHLQEYGGHIKTWGQVYDLERQGKNLKYSIDYLKDNIHGSHLTFDTIEPFTLAFFSTISLAAIAGIIYYSISFYNSHCEYQEDVTNLNFILNHINDAAKANLIINVSSRLGIELKDLTIEELIENLQIEINNINYRWKKRLAFLGGHAEDNANAYNHDFLLADGSRDVTNRIFDKAGLGMESLRFK
jgi:hypothetical protein